METGQASTGANPQIAARILPDKLDHVIGQAVPFEVVGDVVEVDADGASWSMTWRLAAYSSVPVSPVTWP